MLKKAFKWHSYYEVSSKELNGLEEMDIGYDCAGYRKL